MRTVDRSERVRTYNFPENRISDHRVGYKAYNLDQVLDGDLDARGRRRWSTPTTPQPLGLGDVTTVTAGRRCARRVAAAPAGSPRPASTSPRHDAEELAAHVLGVPRAALVAADAVDRRRRPFDDAGRPAGRPRAAAAPDRRAPASATSSSPSGPGVFVPRPETELVAGWALDARWPAPAGRPSSSTSCTGSGAIALAVAARGARARSCTPSSSTRRARVGRRNVAADRRPR